MNNPVKYWQDRCDQAYDDYQKRIAAIATAAFHTFVTSFCKKRGWDFTAGMGTYAFGDETGATVDPDDEKWAKDEEFTFILDICEVCPDDGDPIGTIMPDYPGKDK